MSSSVSRHYIYLPGLGDYYDEFRRLMLRTWPLRKNVSVEMVPMHWLDQDETFEQKQQRVLAAIARAPKLSEIVLVGESAGGSMAISMLSLASDETVKVVTICGKNIHPDNISPKLMDKNIAFRDAVAASQKVVYDAKPQHLERIHAIYSLLDEVVSPGNTFVSGARSSAVRIPGHLLSIVVIVLARFRLVQS